MTAVTDAALARLSASIQNSSSMKLSLAGKAVPCTRNTSRPRTFSSTRTNRLPSEKRSVSDCPSLQPRYSAIELPRRRLAEPAKSRNSSSTAETLRTSGTDRDAGRGQRRGRGLDDLPPPQPPAGDLRQPQHVEALLLVIGQPEVRPRGGPQHRHRVPPGRQVARVDDIEREPAEVPVPRRQVGCPPPQRRLVQPPQLVVVGHQSPQPRQVTPVDAVDEAHHRGQRRQRTQRHAQSSCQPPSGPSATGAAVDQLAQDVG